MERNTWQMNTIMTISAVGIIILVLVLISAVLNRKIISRLSLGWVLFSVLMLLVVGWGTMENGLILYSLYFGWPFLVLLFQLSEKIGKKLKMKYFLPAVSLVCTACLLYVNIPAMMEMISFAIYYYPA